MLGNFSDGRDHDARQRQRFGFRHPRHQPDAEVGQHRADVALAPERAQTLGRLGELTADDRLEQFVLRVEIGVKRALGDARGAGDVVHARPVEAGGEERGARAVHDLAPLGAAVMMRARFAFESFRFHSP